MDDRWSLFPLPDSSEQATSEKLPLVHRSVEPVDTFAVPQRLALRRESSMIVYCGSDERVNEGFALALFAMGLGAHPHEDIARPTESPDREDD